MTEVVDAFSPSHREPFTNAQFHTPHYSLYQRVLARGKAAMSAHGSFQPDEPAALFYIGQHDGRANIQASPDVLSLAYGLGYDFLTTPITTSAFHSRVVAQAKDLLPPTDTTCLPTLNPLTPQDSNLAPNEGNSALVGFVSAWIDLGSPNPVIAKLSQRVLNAEVAYAAFCGINTLIVHGPSAQANVVQYARDIREALALGPFVQLHILLPMTGELEHDYADSSPLAELVAESEVDLDDDDDLSRHTDLYGVWKDWNTIRTICSYSQKLSLGMLCTISMSASTFFAHHFSKTVSCTPARRRYQGRKVRFRNSLMLLVNES